MTACRDSRRPHGGAGGPAVSDRLDFAALTIRQPAWGYRFSIDAVLLADFAAPLCGETALDLGTGCGVVLLLLARLRPSLRRGVGVEIQASLWKFARGNFEENGLSDRLTAVHADFRRAAAGAADGRFDLVVSNPPYVRVGEGRRNPDPQKETARHEVTCTLSDLMRAAKPRLSPGGAFAMVGPAHRLTEILAKAAENGIAPRTLRFVHPFHDRPAALVLFAGGAERSPGPEVLPPLVIYAEKDRYHPDVDRIYRSLLKK